MLENKFEILKYVYNTIRDLNDPNKESTTTNLYTNTHSFIVEKFANRIFFAPAPADFKCPKDFIQNNPVILENLRELFIEFYKIHNITFNEDIKNVIFCSPKELDSQLLTSEIDYCYFIKSTHIDGTDEGWKSFKAHNIAAIGWNHINLSEIKNDDLSKYVDKPSEARALIYFRGLKYGDLICCRYSSEKLYGIGVVLSSHKYEKNIHYYGEIKNGEKQYYDKYVDVCWFESTQGNNYISKTDLNPQGESTWQARGTLSYVASANHWIPDFLAKYLKINKEYVINEKSYKSSIIKNSPLKNKLLELLLNNQNLVITGSPGTGKTYLAKDIAETLNQNLNIKNFVQFHPSYDYTDFVEGLRPVDKGNGEIVFERQDGIFKKFCKEAARDTKPHSIYVFIIDEFNRGQLSKIFGELFYAIDPDYRGPQNRIETQYQNLVKEDDPFYEGFYVPDNVYLICTMNNIDRNVDTIDFAIRRRFSWYNLKAKDNTAMLDHFGENIKARIVNKMDRINNCIFNEQNQQEDINQQKNIEGLTSDFHIGGAYFAKIKNYLDDEDNLEKAFKMLWDYHLKDLILEYVKVAEDPLEAFKKIKQAYFSK